MSNFIDIDINKLSLENELKDPEDDYKIDNFRIDDYYYDRFKGARSISLTLTKIFIDEKSACSKYVYAEKPKQYVTDGTLFTEKVFSGEFGSMVLVDNYESNIEHNFRVDSVIIDKCNGNVLFRKSFYDNRNKNDIIKVKKINCFTMSIYLKGNFMENHSVIFSDNFHTKFEYSKDRETMLFTFYLPDVNTTYDANKLLFENFCKNNNLTHTYDDHVYNNIRWDFVDRTITHGSTFNNDIQKFNLQCNINDDYHQLYKKNIKQDNITFLISWDNIIKQSKNCPGCKFSEDRKIDKQKLMDIFNENDKSEKCEKIMNFINEKLA